MDDGIDRGNGHVRLSTLKKEEDFARARWNDLSFALGGLAGELVELGRFRSGNCRQDLKTARAAANDIHRYLAYDPSWERVEDPGLFDPAKTFRDISEQEARILRIGYARARAIILLDRDSFNELVHALLGEEHPTINWISPCSSH
jgi:hypothetical protein